MRAAVVLSSPAATATVTSSGPWRTPCGSPWIRCGTTRPPSPPPPDLVVLPGGFSYGDYLRSGAMAARSPLMEAVRAHADAGGAAPGDLQRLPDPHGGSASPGGPPPQRLPDLPVPPLPPPGGADRHALHGALRPGAGGPVPHRPTTRGSSSSRRRSWTSSSGGNRWSSGTAIPRGTWTRTGTPQRLPEGHRGDPQPPGERAGAHAPPGAGLRSPPGRGGRPGDVAIGAGLGAGPAGREVRP